MRSIQYAFSAIQSRDDDGSNQDGESGKIKSDKILYIFWKYRYQDSLADWIQGMRKKKKKQESRMIPIFWLSNNGRIELPTTKMGKAAGGEG